MPALQLASSGRGPHRMQIHVSDCRDRGKRDRKAKGNNQNGKDQP
jgi:hypothetical protein